MGLKLLFIINRYSGNSDIDWGKAIKIFFAETNHRIEFYSLTKSCTVITLKERIKLFLPNIVVAVGGDGTVKIVAESLLHTKIPLGILPAGSANGMAKEIGINNEPELALKQLLNSQKKQIHLLEINKQFCIHLSDIGLNAFALQKFENQGIRGMWGYFLATLKVLWQNPIIDITMQIKGEIIQTKAQMIIIANATTYGSGILINPVGNLQDEIFEVIIIKKISPFEVFKINYTKAKFNTEKTEIYQTNSLSMKSNKKVHFQIDGEYIGKIKQIKANLVPKAIYLLFPNV
jgi:diacylglycerol kinase (ATP)